jgi:hypothetical protein
MIYIVPGFLIWPTFQGYRCQTSSVIVVVCYSMAQFLTVGDIDWNFVHMHPKVTQPHRPIWFLCGPPGAKPQNTKNAITPQLMEGSSPTFCHRYIVQIRDIVPGFYLFLKVTEIKLQLLTAPKLRHFYGVVACRPLRRGGTRYALIVA